MRKEDPSRVYLCEQRLSDLVTARMTVILNGVRQSPPFLQFTGLGTSGEQGMLGFAFHPNYDQNGYFYVSFVDNTTKSRIVRYSRDANNPNLADASSAFPILSIQRNQTNHNGGTIRFGEDGLLYIGTGDSGSGNDPLNAAQSLTDLRGKMLRIDVNGDDFPSDGNRNYRIPSTNPYAVSGGAPEIYHVGLRNPWKYDFDRRSIGGFGGLMIADVGQNSREEIDSLPENSPPVNLGWRVWEGFLNTGLGGGAGPFYPPIHDYDHSLGCSIGGSAVYRGMRLGMDYWGRYFFLDYCRTYLKYLPMTFNPVTGLGTAGAAVTTNVATPSNPVGLTTGGDGEIYLYAPGQVLKIVATSPKWGCKGSFIWNGLAQGRYPLHLHSNFRSTGTQNSLGDLTFGQTTGATFAIPAPQGAIDMSVKWGTFLRRTLPANTTSADAVLTFHMINGDIVDDNIIDLGDFDALALAFGSEPNDSNWNIRADLNGDDVVNLGDFDIVAQNFGMEGDQ